LTTERRYDARIETKVHMTCRIPARPCRTTMQDVSHFGCRLDVPEGNVELGGTVLVDLPGAAMFPGRVVWIRGSQVGVRFLRRLRGAPAVALGLEQAEPEVVLESQSEPRSKAEGLLSHWFRRLTGRLV
jgi:hypothetical protein